MPIKERSGKREAPEQRPHQANPMIPAWLMLFSADTAAEVAALQHRPPLATR